MKIVRSKKRFVVIATTDALEYDLEEWDCAPRSEREQNRFQVWCCANLRHPARVGRFDDGGWRASVLGDWSYGVSFATLGDATAFKLKFA